MTTTTPNDTVSTPPVTTTAPDPIHVLIARDLKAVFAKWGVSAANAKWTESDSAGAEFIYTRDGDAEVPAGYAGVQLTSVSRRDIA